MHPFHDYISKQLADKLMKRRVAVWYDVRMEFGGYIGELRGGRGTAACRLEDVRIGDLNVCLCCFCGSLFELKFAVDPIVAKDEPDLLLVYLPGVSRDEEVYNVLLELDRAGIGFDWKLAQLAHLCLRDYFSLDRVDQMIAGNITYEDMAEILKDAERGGAGDGSILAAIFPDARLDAQCLAAWLVSPEKDEVIMAKGGRGEIERLLGKIGCGVESQASLADLRQRAARHVLVGEFVLDLKGTPPASVILVAPPTNTDQRKVLRQTAENMRTSHHAAYTKLADDIELKFQLAASQVPAEQLGSIDTFRFEEQRLLKRAGQLIAEKSFAPALAIVVDHARSFWADREPRRQQQWEACRRMAALGVAMVAVRAGLPKDGASVGKWIDGYTEPEGWHRADMLYRQLESHLASMTDVPDSEAAHTAIVDEYEDLMRLMANGFMASFKEATWQFSKGTLRQTQIFDELVAPSARGSGLVAMVLADSLRYEMGMELSKQFDDAKEMILKTAVATIPTITPIGMAALLPGAAASFDVVSSGVGLGVGIAGKVLTGLKDRLAFLRASFPGTKDIALDELLAMSSSQVKAKLQGATFLVVRAQDIDQMGETGKGNLARQVMDTAVSNIARGIRKLAQNGVARFVVAADHGHLFGRDKDQSMRLDAPGGDTVDLHRRCWIGRGGVTPAGAIRLTGADLGYNTDLDFIFPTGTGVFKAGGDLGYHHGGLSLQELIVPVLMVVLPVQSTVPTAGLKVEIKDVPARVTNRMFRLSVSVTGTLFGEEKIMIRPSLVAKGLQVGEAGMALDAIFDATTKCVTLEPGKTAIVMMVLKCEGLTSLRVLVEDASSGAALFQSHADIPVEVN